MGTRTLVCGAGDLYDELVARLRARGHLVETLGLSSLVARPTAEMAVDTAAAALGAVDLLVHVLESPGQPIPLVDLSTDDWVAVCEDPMVGALHLLQACRPHLGPGSRVVHVVPTSAMGGAPGFAATATAAEGIRALNKSAARQWGTDGITTAVVAAAPELLIGPAASSSGGALSGPALGRTGGAEDLAGIIDTLASPDAAFTSGSTIVADGGTWMAP
ncbi:MAG: SDR family oxidoreductase [Acidimicrobiales bacterium]|mgnify:CR=1 FL=1|jgi:3-oxoacyl-[acyl-carrier protein] reductase|nr:SDR family oxidoreductase [Acidimicrobiales bacterium]|tara:strand:- start:5147 stop:5800 length:654 start_codon:yes stop_codon:yes gene_type:complete